MTTKETAAATPRDHTTKYYTPNELADLWRCSRDIVYDLLTSGRLKGFKLGNSWRISDEARLDYEQTPADRPLTRTQRGRTVLKIH